MEEDINDNWFPVSHHLMESDFFKNLHLSSRVLFVYMCKFGNRYGGKNKGWFYRSLKRLAKDTGLNINTVKAAKEQLLAEGLIDARTYLYSPNRRKLASVYKVLF